MPTDVITPNSYAASSSTAMSLTTRIITGNAQMTLGSGMTFAVIATRGIDPRLYFTYVKSKLGLLERMKTERRLKSIEKAFDAACKNGQSALGEKLLNEVVIAARETEIFTKGIKMFIDRADLLKHKHNIRGGHISDTQLKDFTRVIPKDVLAKKEKVKHLFDGFVIYHYWAEGAEDVKKMSPEEKAKMKDPILFGWINENNRMYYIADWEDEYCDLSFDELVDVIGKDEKEITIQKTVKNL